MLYEIISAEEYRDYRYDDPHWNFIRNYYHNEKHYYYIHYNPRSKQYVFLKYKPRAGHQFSFEMNYAYKATLEEITYNLMFNKENVPDDLIKGFKIIYGEDKIYNS